MTETTVGVAHVEHVSTITMQRPEKLNAIDQVVLRDLDRAITECEARAETRVVIVTGAGKAFIAGADIAAMTTMSSAESAEFSLYGHRVFARLESLRCPVIAAVNGFALGGGLEVALACDFIHASEKAKFGLPEVGLGVIPGFGGTQRLERRIPLALAREWVFAGRTYDAAEAHRVGLVNRVHPHDTLLANVEELAREIASKGPLAVSVAKRVMLAGVDLPLGEATALEARGFGELFGTADQREGMAAFVAKRPHTFSGR